jgi:CrcB protein
MWKSIVAIALGATLGALLRWEFGLKLNHLFPSLPLGTLTANLIGGYLIGFAIAYFAQAPGIAPEWRLFIITGFCGGLTTFSTFSAEVVMLLFQQERLALAIIAIGFHVAGSLLMTLAGMGSWYWLKLHLP